MPFTLLAVAILIVLAGGLGCLVYRAGVRTRKDRPDAEWLQSFSAARYQPMIRMLSPADEQFLLSSGIDRKTVRRARTERRKIFRLYLNNLVRDFNRLHWAAQTMVLASDVDRPELAARLVRIRFEFQRTVLKVRFHLLLHGLGLHTVEVRQLVAALEVVHSDFRSLMPAAPGFAA